MYTQLKNKSTSEQIELITRSLIALKSYNGTTGESEKALFIYKLISSFPYFKHYPERVWLQEVPNDPIGRKNVFAFVKGASSKTVVFHAHYDTVGTDDYGALQDMAHDPDFLQKFFMDYEGEEKVKEDALSGNWLFGRGSLDMQSGIAVHLANLLFHTGDKQPDGNLLFLFNGDEESEHAGMIAALSDLHRLKNEGLDYLAAINTDFISPIYDGDCKRYIYTGAAGKLLPSFYIYGREAHVGDVLTSIDPTVIASKINLEINQNLDYLEDIPGEFTLPPSCLYFKDDKHTYNVQTPLSASLYFNYFVYERTAREVLYDMKKVALKVVSEMEERSKRQFEQYRSYHGFPEREFSWEVEVLTLREYIFWLKERGIDPDPVMKKIFHDMEGEDRRTIAYTMVEALQHLDPDRTPRVILFFAPPFLPHNFVNEENEYGKKVREVLGTCLDDISNETGEEFVIKRFFPYLADGSFLSLHEEDEDIEVFKKNLPLIDHLYPVPIDMIRKLNIPSINIGVYGKDGHQWTERVYKPYTFSVLPEIIRRVTKDLLEI
ncbi:M20/M25/M40 family metallo-hydrolase [Rossellomorea vietnamensis]|uniref:M20/M25/M40 family metallo-hydrolase n=1 Tax=Rossellomorea vietnamensis TaxID=218284 RepID=A0ACD4CBD7_9BACI|nr:M20/M25/M40 family metallo-hydrolase [Rossellomorea vietnamensis]UXH45936.1 M20/M25/M40 family metallo-hydrolase [Rossellomorea vietnamensis]WQI97329.1 M20/M25/M40 family metallo-hydrolase [Rossellomorea vietnamensis]